MAETFANSTVNSAVAAITSWKASSTTASEQDKPESLGMQHSEAQQSPREPEANIPPVDSPLAIIRSAAVPTSSMDVGLDDILEQSIPLKFPKRFVKAPSINCDPAADFVFAKPKQPPFTKPKQPPMNLPRRMPAYELGIPDPADGSRDSNSPISSHEWEPIAAEPTATATFLTTNASTSTGSSSEDATAETNVTEPKTATTTSIQDGSELAKDNASQPEEIDKGHNASPPAPSPEVTDVQGPPPTSDDMALEETSNKFQSRSNSILTETVTPKQADRHIGLAKSQSLNRPMRTPEAHVLEKTGSPHVSTSKVTKSRQRRHSNATSRSRIDLADLTSKTSVTEEDLLQVLLTRYSRDKQEKEQLRTDHATEIYDLETLSHSLWDRLKESEQRMADQESELSKYRDRQPRFASQIKKLRDYVKGLTNDQQGLRDNFMSMQRMYSATRESKQQIDKSLQEVRAKASDIDKRAANALKDAGHEIDSLARVVQNQKARLQKDAELLQHERERSQRLELEVANINANQQQSMHVFAQHGNCVVEKMNNLLEKTKELQSAESLNKVNATLGECQGSLSKLHAAQDIRVEHLSALDGSMKHLANSIASRLQTYHNDVKSYGANNQNAHSGFREQFTNLATSIETVTQQISSYRTEKVETDAKLDAMDTALQAARLQQSSKDDYKRELEKQFAGLKSAIVTLQSEPTESPATAAHLTETKAQYQSIEKKLIALQASTEESSQRLQDQFEERANMQLHKEDLESKLKEEQEKAQVVADQRLEVERKANKRFEDIRVDLLHKAEFDRNVLAAEHRLALAELEKKLVQANEAVQKMTARVDQQSLEHDKWWISITEMTKQLIDMRSLKEVAENSVEDGLKKIAILNKEQFQLLKTDAEKTADIQKLQIELDCTRGDLEEKEAQLTEKTTELEKKKTELVKKETELEEKKTELVEKQTELLKKETEVEEKETEVAKCQQSLRLGVADIKMKDQAIQEKDNEITKCRSEARGAQDALQACKDDHEAEICGVKKSYEAEILSLKGEIEVVNASVVTLTKALGEANSVGTSKPRRKADRNATQELQQVIKESQSQGDDDMLDTISPRQVELSTQTSNDGMEYLDLEGGDELDVPPTPRPSSQVVKKTVTFVSDRSSAYFGSQHTSPSKTRPLYQENRIVEDSQDRAASLMQPSFETPSYRSTTTYSQRQSETFREPPPASSLPRSALKSSNTASKRSSTNAGHTDQGGEPKRNRRGSTVGPGLGPVLPDMMSPSGNLHRPRRQASSTKSGTATKAKGTLNRELASTETDCKQKTNTPSVSPGSFVSNAQHPPDGAR